MAHRERSYGPNDLVDPIIQLRMIKQFVEGFHSQCVQHEGGKIERQGQRQPLFHRFGCQFPGLIVIATHEDAPAQVITANQDIDPGHGVFIILVRFG